MALLFCSLFLGSCIKEDLTESIDTNGKANFKVRMRFDLEAMKNMAAAASSGGSGSLSTMEEGDLCKDFDKNKFIYLTNARCTAISKDTADIEGVADLKENGWFSTSGGYYLFDTKSVPLMLSREGQEAESVLGQSSSADYDPKKMEEAYRKLGIELTYQVTMPGEIVSADGSDFSGSVATINFYRIAAGKAGFVKAKANAAAGNQNQSASENTKIDGIKILSLSQQKAVKRLVASKTDEELRRIAKKIDVLIASIKKKKTITRSNTRTIKMLEDILVIINEKLNP